MFQFSLMFGFAHKDIGLFELTQTGFMFDARRTDEVGGNWELRRHFGPLGSPSLLVQSNPTDLFNRRSSSRRDGLISFIGLPTGIDRLSRLKLDNGSLQHLSNFTQLGPTLGYSPNGSLAFSASNGTQLGLWKPNGSVVMLAMPSGRSGFVLPGR